MITEQQLIAKITESFVTEEVAKDKNVKPCRIKWMGKFVRLKSGKTVWKNLGAAKNALRNHFDSSKLYVHKSVPNSYEYCMAIERIIHLMKTGKEFSYEANKIYNEWLLDLQKLRILEFVYVDFESLGRLKQ